MGELYEGKIMKKVGQAITIDRTLPRVLKKIATLPLKIAHPYPFCTVAPSYLGGASRHPYPLAPQYHGTFPFLLLIFIIHSHC